MQVEFNGKLDARAERWPWFFTKCFWLIKSIRVFTIRNAAARRTDEWRIFKNPPSDLKRAMPHGSKTGTIFLTLFIHFFLNFSSSGKLQRAVLGVRILSGCKTTANCARMRPIAPKQCVTEMFKFTIFDLKFPATRGKPHKSQRPFGSSKMAVNCEVNLQR